MSGLYRQPGGDADPYVALVIDADEDMLVASRRSRRADYRQSLRPHDIRQLQEHSCYAEVDVSTHRIRDVKNGFGDSILNRFKSSATGPTPIWRFLAFAKPYWPYVAGATVCGLIKFLAPLAFPWMLKVLLDDVVLNAEPRFRTRERENILYLIVASCSRSMSCGWSRRTIAASSPRSPAIA